MRSVRNLKQEEEEGREREWCGGREDGCSALWGAWNPGIPVSSVLCHPLCLCVRLLRAAVWGWRSPGFRTTVPRRLQCVVSVPPGFTAIGHHNHKILWEVFCSSVLHADFHRVTHQEGLFFFFSLKCPTDGGSCSLYTGDWMHPSHNFNCA